MPMKDETIKFKGSLDPNKKCLLADGQGASTLKIETDRTQFPNILKVFALAQKYSLLEFSVKGLKESLKNAGSKKYAKTYR